MSLCPNCSAAWRDYGPNGRRECEYEHVFQRNDDGTFTEVVYPKFTDQQIRHAEVELYRERVVKRIPNRRAALRFLREEREANAMWQHTEGVNP